MLYYARKGDDVAVLMQNSSGLIINKQITKLMSATAATAVIVSCTVGLRLLNHSLRLLNNSGIEVESLLKPQHYAHWCFAVLYYFISFSFLLFYFTVSNADCC